MGKAREKKAKEKMTNRERILHRALALVAGKALTVEDGAEITGKEQPTGSDIESAVASMAQVRIMRLARRIVTRQQERAGNVWQIAQSFHSQEVLALKLVWLCLGGGRNDYPPDPLPAEILVSYPQGHIYRDTARLVSNVLGRMRSMQNSGSLGDEFLGLDEAGGGPSDADTLGFPPFDGLGDTIRHIERRAEILEKRQGGMDYMKARNLRRVHGWLCAYRDMRRERETRPCPMGPGDSQDGPRQLPDECKRLQKENEFLRQQLESERRKREGTVRQFALEVIQQLAGPK